MQQQSISVHGRTQINGVTQMCDASALQECFKKYPTNRQEMCRVEIDEFQQACELKAK